MRPGVMVWLWSSSHLWIITFSAALSRLSLRWTGSSGGEGIPGHRHSRWLWEQMVKEKKNRNFKKTRVEIKAQWPMIIYKSCPWTCCKVSPLFPTLSQSSKKHQAPWTILLHFSNLNPTLAKLAPGLSLNTVYVEEPHWAGLPSASMLWLLALALKTMQPVVSLPASP